MTPLSVVIITFNEEKNIGRCLESVKEVADEIIVVDSLSTDNTKTICASYNVKFIEQRFLGTLVHPFDALQPVNAPAQTDHRREKPRRRPGDGLSEIGRAHV